MGDNGFPVFDYPVQRGDSLSGILLEQGAAKAPAEAGRLAESIARQNGAPVYNLQQWSDITRINPNTIHARIGARFGETPPNINFINIHPGDRIVSDGQSIKIVPNMSGHIVIDGRGGPTADQVPSGYLELMDHCASRDFIDTLERVTGQKLTAQERARLEKYQKNFRVVFSHSEKTRVEDKDPENPVIYIQLSPQIEPDEIKYAPHADAFMHEFYHAVAGYIDGPPYVVESNMQCGFGEGVTDLYSSRHLAELHGEPDKPLTFPGMRSSDTLRAILLEQVLGEDKTLLRDAYFSDDCSEIMKRFDEKFGGGSFKRFFKIGSVGSNDDGNSAEFVRRLIDAFGLPKAREFLKKAVDDYHFPIRELEEILDQDKVNPKSLKDSLFNPFFDDRPVSRFPEGMSGGIIGPELKMGSPMHQPPPQPVITPRLQEEFSRFLSQWDLSQSQDHEISLENGLRIDIRIGTMYEDKIFVYVYKDGTEGALATLIADRPGKLIELTDAGLEVSKSNRETVALLYEKTPGLPMREALIEAFHIPRVTPELRAREARAKQERAAYQARLDTVQPMKTGDRRKIGDPVGAVEVFTQEYALTRPGEGRSRYIQTFGAGPCVILTLYDPTTKTGLVAHFPATTDVLKSFIILKNHLARHGVDIGKMEARIIGGQHGMSEELILSIRDGLASQTVSIVEQNILLEGWETSSVVMDAETGEVYDYVETATTRQRIEVDLNALQVQMMVGQPLIFYRSDRGLK